MNHPQRLRLAHKSLKGISIGDAFGESFFGETDIVLDFISRRKVPDTRWEFTDDTIMTLSVFEQLEKNQAIDQDELIEQFIIKHNLDVNRGYGSTLRRILREVEEGASWQETSNNVFDGMGSMGNGASMRVGPIGAYYYDDPEKTIKLAHQSAEITHSNIEGICGAIAVALGVGISTRISITQSSILPSDFLTEIIELLPDCDTKSKISKALTVPYSYNIESVKSILGNGTNIISQDTVPFSLWCAAHNLHNFEESLWKAVSILGDRDTICAIVGGMTYISTDSSCIPQSWVDSVEDIDTSEFRDSKRI